MSCETSKTDSVQTLTELQQETAALHEASTQGDEEKESSDGPGQDPILLDTTPVKSRDGNKKWLQVQLLYLGQPGLGCSFLSISFQLFKFCLFADMTVFRIITV